MGGATYGPVAAIAIFITLISWEQSLFPVDPHKTCRQAHG